MIEVYDNFFGDHIHKEIFNKLYHSHNWHVSGGDSNKPEIFWHIEDLQDDEYFSNYLFRIIKDNIGETYRYERIYANGQTAGQCGTSHVDDGDLTFLYYPSPRWELSWQGHLIFAGEERIIEYKPNRAVLFDAKLPHYADAPSRFFGNLRISLAYKLWKE